MYRFDKHVDVLKLILRGYSRNTSVASFQIALRNFGLWSFLNSTGASLSEAGLVSIILQSLTAFY